MYKSVGGTVALKACVRFRHLPSELLPVLECLLSEGKRQGFTPTITGAAYEDYPEGGYHARGYAWDVRTRGVPDPLALACNLKSTLRNRSCKYAVLYGRRDHTDHIHIAYRIDKIQYGKAR